jgi:hypothetical protein
MTRYKITLIGPEIGKRTLILRRPSRDAAIEKAGRAYPGARIVSIEALQDEMAEDDGRRNGNGAAALEKGRALSHHSAQQRHAESLRQLLDAIPPEGAGTTQLAEAVGAAPFTVRKWAAKLEEQGKVVREAGRKGYITVRRVEE